MSTWGRRGVPRAKRNRILKRDGYECQIRDIGCTQLATEVDDIIPVSVSGISREAAADDMLQAVCYHRHRRKTECERLRAYKASNARRLARRRLPSKPHPGD
jgi:hypothetical protein